MSKISTYEVVPEPKLADKLIGTSVGGEIEDVTYNFTLQELLDLFIPLMPANNLQGILDFGNTATQDINLFGTITTTYLDVTDTANLFITYLNEETHIVGGVFDSEDSIGTLGQVLTSTGEGVAWVTLPPIFTPNLEQVLTEGNTSSIGIILDAGLEALDVSTDTATINTNITIDGTITDETASVGSSGQVLSSTVTGVEWVSLPVYSATSPLLFNSATGVFSIQQATSSQNGYLSSSDWITFDGKQNAGNYITALTGEATASGPGAASVTLGNSAVINKVLTGFNPTAGTINASDSILTAFGKTQSQINALVGGVQYQGTWNASTNVPTLTSSVGVQGHYYIVNVAGTTNLNGITDWQVGDWAIFSESTWQKVDNTESVVSVNGFTGAVSLTTDNIPEGSTNLYYLNSRARGALSFAAGSGAYNNVSGVITIPTDNSQILNGAGYITLGSLSATAPLAYNNLTGVFSIQQADATHDGYLSSTDWSTFNNKQNYLGGTGLVKSTAGTITYITDNSGNWNTAYNRSIVSAAVTGTTTKTLTLNEQDGNTITASWTDLDTGLTSVGVSMPSAFSVANSPLTANGTIAVTGAGTTLQYIDGTGALRTFPGLTGYVPYTGATTNVDLGEFGISAGYFQADLTPTGALQVGRMQWNSTDGTMDLRLLGNNVTLQIGQENVTRVVNKSGIDLLEANYQVVRIRKVAEGGAQGQRLAVVLAQGNNENNSTEVIGLVTETILVNQEGFVTSFGEVKSINTTGSLQGETWVDGDILYLSSTVAGQLTNIRPVAPNHSVIVGYVVYAHANNGKIYMAIDTGYELGELHNVYAPSPTANQSIYWDTTNSRYQLNTIGGILGYTPANAATTISTTAPLQGGGDLSANRTFSITQSGASTDGYLSSTDWNTFNNKQPAGSYVPTSRQLTINGTAYDLSADRSWSVGTVTSVAALTLGTTGTDLSSSVATGTTTPVITLNVPTASAANRGALSAADWSTFNTKVGSVTASTPLASSGGSTPNITIQQSSGSQDGYLSSTDWTTFNNKQAAGNYITSLTGEATGTGPGATAVTLNNASVTAKILTGINITGGTVQATDTMLTAFGKLQNQINGLIGSTIYQGTWNASTNTPALASGVGVRGYYYIVSVAGNTNLDGITDWFVGDWAIFDGTAWQQVDNTDAVVSVNGQTGAVSLTTDNIPEGATNQYYLDSRARAALSFTAGSGAYNSTTGVITIPTNTSQLTNGANFITLASLSGTAPIQYNNTTGSISITQAGTASNGYLSSTDWNTFNNKQPAGTYVNSVTATGPLASSGGVNPNITISQANTSTNGFLSSTDWNTFNSKAPSVVGGYLALSGGVMTGQIVLAAGTTSTDYTKGLRFPNDPYGGSGDISGLRLYAETTTGAEAQVLELYVANDGSAPSTDRINFAAPTNDLVTVNGNKIWNAGNLTPQSAITLTTTGTSGAATLVGATLNIPQYQSVLTNPVTGTGTVNRIALFTTSGPTIGDSIIYDNSTNISVGSSNNSRSVLTNNGQFYSYYSTEVNPRVIIDRDLLGGGLSGIGFTDRDGTLAVWGAAVGLSAARELGFFVSNGTSLVKYVSINSSGLSTFNGDVSIGSAGSTTITNSGTTPILNMIRNNNASSPAAQINFKTSQSTTRWQIATNSATGTGFEINEGDGVNNRFYIAPTTGAFTFSAIDNTGNRTSPFNTFTITTDNPNAPYEAFGGSILFNNRSYTHGIVSSSRIRSTIWDGGSSEGGGFIFETTPTAGGTLTPTMTLKYTGYVGVGTISPNYKLQVGDLANTSAVWNDIFITGDRVNNDGYYARLIFGNSSQSGGCTASIRGERKTSNFGTELSFYTNTSGSSGDGTERMRIAHTGNVGIGIAVPAYTLDVNKSVAANFVARIANPSSTGYGLYVQSNNDGLAGIRVANSAGATAIDLFGNGAATFSGYVSVGNTSSLTKLNVNNAVSGAILPYIQGTGLSYNSEGISVAGSNTNNTNIGNGLTLYNNVASVNAYAPVIAFSSMTVGGAYNATYAFITGQYKGAGGDNNWAVGELIFGTGNAYGAQERMRLSRVGFLGIGSSDPTNPLHVVDGSYNRYTIRVQSAAANNANGYGGIGLAGEESNTKGAILFQSIASNSYSRGNMLFCLNNAQDQSSAVPSDAVLTLYTVGRNAVFVSSVTATAFYESSDSRLKQLIKDDYKALGIEAIKPKLYIKNGKEEVGYFAQDVQGILSTAVSVNDAGYLNLSYTQVHTAKIAIIEDEVDVLKKEVAELKVKLQKYEA